MKSKILYILLTTIIFTACSTSTNYKIETELTAEQQAEATAEIETLTQILKDFESGNKQTYLNYYKENTANLSLEDIVNYGAEIDKQDTPPLDIFISKSRAEKSLGNIDTALETLEDGLAYYPDSVVLHHNTAKMYDQVKACKKSEEHYQHIINTWERSEYNYDIARCYMKSDTEGNNLDKVYNSYKTFLQTNPDSKDSQIDEYLKEYRK